MGGGGHPRQRPLLLFGFITVTAVAMTTQQEAARRTVRLGAAGLPRADNITAKDFKSDVQIPENELNYYLSGAKTTEAKESESDEEDQPATEGSVSCFPLEPGEENLDLSFF